MKFSVKLPLLALVAIAVLSITGCKKDNPKAVAEKYLNALYHMDYDGAKTVATDETKSMLEMLSQFSSMMPDSSREAAKKVVITITKEEMLSDTTARITYTTSEVKQEQTIKLVKRSEKENGEKKWLVLHDKSDNGNTPEESSEEPVTDTTTGGTVSPMPTDTSAAK